MKIITISGLDGSGKSTQIELLKKFLKSQGKSFYYFHSVQHSIATRMLGNERSEARGEKSITKANWLKIQLRKIALLVDIFRFKRLLRKFKTNYIISDRYFYDIVVNINYLSEKNKRLFAERFIPKPDFAFYLKVSPEKIMQREQKPDQGLEYLIAKDKLFSDKIKEWNIVMIDGNGDKEAIFKEIVSKIHV